MRYFRLIAISVLLLACVALGAACTGAKGRQGADGAGIQSIANNTDGTLTIYLSNGQSYTTGDLTGPQGAKGDTGAQGEQGIEGPQGLPGVGIAWQGEWSSAIAYRKHDAVSWLGSSYVSKQGSNTNHPPTDTIWWDPWVAKGETGATGADGQDGAPGPNMIVAMGFIIGNGTIGKGYNVTSCSWNSTQEYYEITLTGIDYTTGGYVTLVTVGGPHAFGVYQSSAGKLCVSIIGTSGNPSMASFSFMVLEGEGW